jgi:hypothetical protein
VLDLLAFHATICSAYGGAASRCRRRRVEAVAAAQQRSQVTRCSRAGRVMQMMHLPVSRALVRRFLLCSRQ